MRELWKFLWEIDVERDKDLRAYLDSCEMKRRRLIGLLLIALTSVALALVSAAALKADAAGESWFVTGFAILSSLLIILGTNLISIQADPPGTTARRRAPASGALLWLACFSAIVLALTLPAILGGVAKMRHVDACAKILREAARDHFKSEGTRDGLNKSKALTCTVS